MKPDFASIIKGGTAYNFHTHTQYCDGRDDMERMATMALALGFGHIGFTPHSPVPIESACNMSVADVRDYMTRVDALARNAAGRCRFYAGMEIDYLGPQWGPSAAYFGDLGLDFCIGSVHFIPAQSGELIDIDGHYDRFARNMHDHFRDDLRYVVTCYFEQSMAMLSAGHFDILGHFDKIAQNASYHCADIEQQGWYNDLLETYIRQIIGSGVWVEVNTKARAEHRRFFPHERLWPRLVAAGVPLLVNSDAHYAARLNASRAEALDILHTVGYGA